MSKEDRLRESGMYNPDYAKVRDEDFLSRDMFDARDILQVRYEIARAICLGERASDVAERFGVSEATARRYCQTLRDRGLIALAPQKRGPKARWGLGEEGKAFVDAYLMAHPQASAAEVYRALEAALDTCVSQRTVDRYVADWRKNGRPSGR